MFLFGPLEPDFPGERLLRSSASKPGNHVYSGLASTLRSPDFQQLDSRLFPDLSELLRSGGAMFLDSQDRNARSVELEQIRVVSLFQHF